MTRRTQADRINELAEKAVTGRCDDSTDRVVTQSERESAAMTMAEMYHDYVIARREAQLIPVSAWTYYRQPTRFPGHCCVCDQHIPTGTRNVQWTRREVEGRTVQLYRHGGCQ